MYFVIILLDTLGVAQTLMHADCEHLKIAKFSGCN